MQCSTQSAGRLLYMHATSAKLKASARTRTNTARVCVGASRCMKRASALERTEAVDHADTEATALSPPALTASPAQSWSQSAPRSSPARRSSACPRHTQSPRQLARCLMLRAGAHHPVSCPPLHQHVCHGQVMPTRTAAPRAVWSLAGAEVPRAAVEQQRGSARAWPPPVLRGEHQQPPAGQLERSCARLPCSAGLQACACPACPGPLGLRRAASQAPRCTAPQLQQRLGSVRWCAPCAPRREQLQRLLCHPSLPLRRPPRRHPPRPPCPCRHPQQQQEQQQQ